MAGRVVKVLGTFLNQSVAQREIYLTEKNIKMFFGWIPQDAILRKMVALEPAPG